MTHTLVSFSSSFTAPSLPPSRAVATLFIYFYLRVFSLFPSLSQSCLSLFLPVLFLCFYFQLFTFFSYIFLLFFKLISFLLFFFSLSFFLAFSPPLPSSYNHFLFPLSIFHFVLLHRLFILSFLFLRLIFLFLISFPSFSFSTFLSVLLFLHVNFISPVSLSFPPPPPPRRRRHRHSSAREVRHSPRGR